MLIKLIGMGSNYRHLTFNLVTGYAFMIYYTTEQTHDTDDDVAGCFVWADRAVTGPV